AALRIGAPDEHPARADLRERVGARGGGERDRSRREGGGRARIARARSIAHVGAASHGEGLFMKGRSGVHTSLAIAALLALGAAAVATAKEETFSELVKRLQKEKPTFAKRQQSLLSERYDLADRPAKGVTMSKGKPVQEGVRVKLPKG